MPDKTEVGIEKLGDLTVFHAVDALRFQEFLESDNSKTIVINLRRSRVASSELVGRMITHLEKLRKRSGDLVVCELSEEWQDLFAAARLGWIFETYITQADAIEAIRSGEFEIVMRFSATISSFLCQVEQQRLAKVKHFHPIKAQLVLQSGISVGEIYRMANREKVSVVRLRRVQALPPQ